MAAYTSRPKAAAFPTVNPRNRTSANCAADRRALSDFARLGRTNSPLPAYVRSELEQYLDCGLLCRGSAWLECESRHAQKLVAFSCICLRSCAGIPRVSRSIPVRNSTR
jgi:hypothetical protein